MLHKLDTTSVNGLQTSLDAKASKDVATPSAAGLLSASDKTKLNGVATGATLNAADSALRDRTTHTGVQAIATVTGLQAALDSLKTVVTPEQYGAVSVEAGGTNTNNYTALLTALQSGSIVDGGGKTYKIDTELLPTTFKGLRNISLGWLNTTAMALQKALLHLRDKADVFVENCVFDMGTVSNTGSLNDSDRQGLRISASTPADQATWNKRIRIENVRVFGYGNGSRISIRYVKGLVLSNITIHDALVSGTSDPTNDCMNGLELFGADQVSVTNVKVDTLQSQIAGNPLNAWSRGLCFVYCSNMTVANCLVRNVDQAFDFSGGIVTGTAPDGNRNITVSNCQANTVRTWGFKFANVARNIRVSNCIADNYGYAGFVCSPQTGTPVTSATYSTQNITFENCFAGSAYSGWATGTRAGFMILKRDTDAGYPRNIRYSNCEVLHTGAVNDLQYGFYNEVSTTLLGDLRNRYSSTCKSTGHAIGMTSGFSPKTTLLSGTGTQAIASGTSTIVTWNQRRLDGGSLETGTWTEYTADCPGIRRLRPTGLFSNNTTGYRQLQVLLNGGSIAGGIDNANATIGTPTTVGRSVEVYMTTNDKLRIEVVHTAGSSLDLMVANSQWVIELVESVIS